MSNEIKEKEEYEKFARDHSKELDAQEVKLGDVVTVLVGHFAGEKGVIVGMIACDKSDYADPYYEIEMECDVPEEFRVRKTIIGQSRVIGGVERRHLKVIGNRAPKQPSMEIKQGDKVRVSKDAPRVYLSSVNNLFRYHECKVEEVDGDSAIIRHTDIGIDRWLAIPIKYLIKVDAEAKEVKLKKGDRVKYVGKEHPESWNEVFTVDGEIFYNDYHKNMQIDSVRCEKYNLCNVPLSDLVLYTEPTEQTEASADALGNYTLIPMSVNPIIGFEQEYWKKYTADLAKEVAVNNAKDNVDPIAIAEYAVELAKAVVDGLKRK